MAGSSPEAVTFQCCFDFLNEGIKHSLPDLVPVFYTKGLITASNRDKALQRDVAADERACTLLSVLQSRFQTDPPSFSVFLQVLKSFPALQFIGSKMQEDFSGAQKTALHTPRENVLQADPPTLKDLQGFTRGGENIRVVEMVCANWERIAVALNFPHYIIGQIERDSHKAYDQCLNMFGRWLKRSPFSTEPATWSSLIAALRDCDEGQLGEDLERIL